MRKGTTIVMAQDVHDLYVYRAIILPSDVYDGDSVTADIDLGFGTWLRGQKLRLWGINTPELRGASRKKGIEAREFLRNLLPEDGEVYIRSHKDRKGKYGRWLCEILVTTSSDTNIATNANDLLVATGHAVGYMRD